MKQVIIAVFISVVALADEIGRMESIVADIEKLRLEYTQCMKELNTQDAGKKIVTLDVTNSMTEDLQKKEQMLLEYKNLLEKEQLKNKELTLNIATLDKSLSEMKKQLGSVEKSNKNFENSLKTKGKDKITKNEKEIQSLKLKYANIIKTKDKEILSLKNKINSKNKSRVIKEEICEDDNSFPKLMMKKTTMENDTTQKLLENKIPSKATTYRLKKESKIYNSIDGDVLYIWENKTSFTSTEMTKNWIKVSGYFVDRKWLKAEESLWLKKVNASAR